MALLRLIRPAKARDDDAPSSTTAPSSSSSSSKATSSIPPVDDAQLLAAIRSGDEHAASELHDRLRPRVDMTIRSLLGPGHYEHDDLAQQSFIQIITSLERYRGECSLETWAATITARTVFKYLRHRTVERKVFQEGSATEQQEPSSERNIKAGGSAASASSSSFRIGKQILARDLAERIRRHLEDLDPAKTEAFLLHDVCGFDAREVAGIAGISEAAAHARISRGRRELHAKLAADPEMRDALLDMEGEP